MNNYVIWLPILLFLNSKLSAHTYSSYNIVDLFTPCIMVAGNKTVKQQNQKIDVE
jgi:hypothetical protein